MLTSTIVYRLSRLAFRKPVATYFTTIPSMHCEIMKLSYMFVLIMLMSSVSVHVNSRIETSYDQCKFCLKSCSMIIGVIILIMEFTSSLGIGNMAYNELINLRQDFCSVTRASTVHRIFHLKVLSVRATPRLRSFSIVTLKPSLIFLPLASWPSQANSITVCAVSRVQRPPVEKQRF